MKAEDMKCKNWAELGKAFTQGFYSSLEKKDNSRQKFSHLIKGGRRK